MTDPPPNVLTAIQLHTPLLFPCFIHPFVQTFFLGHLILALTPQYPVPFDMIALRFILRVALAGISIGTIPVHPLSAFLALHCNMYHQIFPVSLSRAHPHIFIPFSDTTFATN